MCCIIARGLRPEFNGFMTTIRGWAKKPSIVELESLLANQEALDKQMFRVTLKMRKRHYSPRREKQSQNQRRKLPKLANGRKAHSQGKLQEETPIVLGNQEVLSKTSSVTIVARRATLLLTAENWRRKPAKEMWKPQWVTEVITKRNGNSKHLCQSLKISNNRVLI